MAEVYDSQNEGWVDPSQEVNPYDLQVTQDTNKRVLLGADAVASAVADGVDPQAAYDEAMSTDINLYKAKQVDEARAGDVDALSTLVDSMATNQPEQLAASAPDLEGLYNQIAEEYSQDNPLAPYIAFIRKFPGAENASDEEIKEVAAQKYMLAGIANLFDEDYGIVDKGLDIGGLLAWPDMAHDAASTFGEVMGMEYVEGYLQTGDIITKFARTLQTLEPEQRVRMFDTLKEKMIGVEDNKLKQAMHLMAAIGESDEDVINLDATFDKLDQLGIGYFLGSSVLKTMKSINTLRQVSKIAGAEREAAVIADIASRSESAAASMGVPRLDAAAAGDPNAKAIEELLDGAPTDVATGVRNNWQLIDESVEEATNIVDEGLGLTEAEKIAAAERRERVLSKQDGIADAVAVPNERGIDLSFTVVDASGVPKAERVSVPYVVDDIKEGFFQDGVTFVGELTKSILNSPNFLQGQDRNLLVQAFERTLFASSKIKMELNNAFNEINKKLTKAESDNVSKILLKGDDADEVYSYRQLVDEGIGGIKLTPKEFTAYASTRKLMDEMWQLKNTEMRRKLLAKGIKEIEIDGELVAAKPYATLQAADEAYRGGTFRTIAIEDAKDGGTKRIDSMSTDDLKAYYEDGYQLVRTSESGKFVRAGDTSAEWALVKADTIRELPFEVLNKKAGYVPRAYENANFFVKQSRTANVDGKDVTVGRKTLRYFDNVTDAKTFVARQVEDARARGIDDITEDDYLILGDREMTVADLEDDFVDVYGGLYTGSRGSEPLRFGLEGEAAERVDALESIQNYINHIGNRYPLAEYRLGIERRWMQHAKLHNAIPKDYTGSFHEAIGLVEHSPAASTVKTKLKNAHAQIEYMNKVPSIGEQQWAGTMRALGRSLEGLPHVGKGLAKYAYKLDHTAPVDAMRSATFNLMLGMYNWAQFFVQASGAAVALSIRPSAAPKAMQNMLSFGLLDNIHNPTARAGAIERISKIPGYGDIAAEYALWKKSGMFDSVVNTNADVASVFKGLPYDAGVVRKIWTNGTLPYKMGELANMRLSFGVALTEWKNMNKGKKLDDIALKSVMARAENFRLSMSKANTSTWQRGWMSIPTQFQQINARFFEAILGNQFSAFDKTAFLMGQFAMFGAAGVPFADMAYGTINRAIGRDVDELETQKVIAERRGLVGYLLNHYANIDANFTGRVAIAQGVIEQLVDMATNPTEISDILLGPSASTKDGAVSVIESLIMTGKTAFSVDDLSVKDATMMLEANLTALAQLPASTRNLLLANDLYNNEVYRTKDGKARYETDANWQTIISQASGFQQQSKADYWDMVMGKKKEAERMKGDVDRISVMYLNMLRFAETDEDQSRAYKLSIDAAIQGYKDEQDKIRVMNAVRNRLKSERDPIGKQVLEMLKTYTSKFADQSAIYNPLVTERIQDARGNE